MPMPTYPEDTGVENLEVETKVAGSASEREAEVVPTGMDGPFHAIAACALGLLGARFVTIHTVPAGIRIVAAGQGPAAMGDAERVCMVPIGRTDGVMVGRLEVFGGRSADAASPFERAMLDGLARISAAMLEQRTEIESALRRWSDAFAKSPSPTWIYDPVSLRFLDVNEAAITFYGYSRDRFLGMTVLDIRPPEHRQRMADAVHAGSDLDAAATWRHCRSDGREVDVITHGRRIVFDGRDAVIVVAVDRTDVLALRKDLTQTQRILDAIIKALPIGLFVKDMRDEGRYVIYNPAMAHTLEQLDQGIVGRTDLDVFDAVEAAEYMKQDRTVMADGGQRTFEAVSIIPRTGDIRQFRTVKKPLPSPDGSPPRFLLGISEDMTERRRSEDRIAYLAMYDTLTDLPNRVLFQKGLDRRLKRQRKSRALALIYIDLDGFKAINDTYGQPAGDLLLKEVAVRLAEDLRRTDDIGRLGGDEFAILLRLGGGEAEAVRIADRILRSLERPFQLGGAVVHVGASLGVALSERPSVDSSESLMRQAAIALQAAKTEGRGIAKVYADGMSVAVRDRQLLSEDLRVALGRHEFELDYQPLYDLVAERICGFEALIRWRHPVRGLIAPGDFIPIAEQTGLIVPIGDWVLDQACRTAAGWPETINVAVNLSAVQFTKRDLVETIERTLSTSGLAPSRLELEITESVLLGDTGANLNALRRLRAIGVRIAMDDFGTGYSSLSYLRCFQFDKIKVDRSFIADIGESEGSLAIVRAVTGLGSSLSMTTTAEGIETSEQFARLKAEGFDELQGYFIGRPMSAERASLLAFSPNPRDGTATAA